MQEALSEPTQNLPYYPQQPPVYGAWQWPRGSINEREWAQPEIKEPRGPDLQGTPLKERKCIRRDRGQAGNRKRGRERILSMEIGLVNKLTTITR